MKKDKEWFKKEIGKSILSSGFDKLTLDMNIMEFEYLIDQLDEPEVLSQDWIDEHAVEGDFRGEQQFWYGRFIEEEKVQNLLVPKQEKPVIPQFVADLIEYYKRQGDSLGELLAHIEYDDVLKNKLEMLSKVVEWSYPDDFSDSEDRTSLIARAWLDGYEVEKEKKYYVDLDTAAYVAKWKGDGSVQIYTDSISGSDEYELHLTEKEIKDYDKRFWAFAEEVTE